MIESDPILEWLKVIPFPTVDDFSSFTSKVGGIIIWRIFSQDVVYRKELVNLGFRWKVVELGHVKSDVPKFIVFKQGLLNGTHLGGNQT